MGKVTRTLKIVREHKVHLKDLSHLSNALCRTKASVYKKMVVTDDIAQVTCANCLNRRPKDHEPRQA